jgi:hypothetical protein
VGHDGNAHERALLEHAKQMGANMVAIRDPGRLASVHALGWPSAVAERAGRRRLAEGLVPA